MAKTKSKMDNYSNRTMATITMSAANTITFQQVRFAAGLFQGIALKLNKIKYYPSTAAVREVVTANDTLFMALTTRDDLTTIDPTNLSVIDSKTLIGIGVPTETAMLPYVSNFTDNPSQGLIIPANPLYLAMNTVGFAAAGVMNVVLEYQFVELSDQDSLELLQTLIPGTV